RNVTGVQTCALPISGSGRDLPDWAPSKLRAVLEFLKLAAPRVKNDVFRPDDPGPALREWWQYTKALWTSAAARVTRHLVRLGPGWQASNANATTPRERGTNAGGLS